METLCADFGSEEGGKAMLLDKDTVAAAFSNPEPLPLLATPEPSCDTTVGWTACSFPRASAIVVAQCGESLMVE